MPRSSEKVPSYCHHKASGRAVVRIEGRDHYLGPYGTPESRQEYARLIAEHEVRRLERPPAQLSIGSRIQCSPYVAEILDAYWEFAKTYYVRDGKPTSELSGVKYAIAPVNELYGATLAAEFGPLALNAVRMHMIREQKLCRTEVNKRIGKIKRAFKWATSEELVPPHVYHGLQSVTGLKKGRSEARESEPVRPAKDQDVDAVLAFVSPQVAAMIRLQRLTGMRSGEVVVMRPIDIVRSGDVWVYSPERHKNDYRGQERQVPLGPKAQEVLVPFLDRPDDSYCFSPAEAERWRYENRPPYHGQGRKTKIYPSELKARQQRKDQRRSKQRKRQQHHRYDSNSYWRAVHYGFKRALKSGVEISHWHPHRLRHARATELRELFGVEAAQVTLGHARADVTQVYAERNLKLAVDVAGKTG